jgi:hypothetical protein
MPEEQELAARLATKDLIAARAYAIFLQRGSAHGYNDDDWYEAERQLVAEGVIPPPPRLEERDAGGVPTH